MNKYKVLINCSNLHSGGGVAVATSFIDCLSEMIIYDLDISLLISTSVMRNLEVLGTDITVFSRCDVTDYFGIASIWRGLDKYFYNIDLVFTVFGPAYFLKSNTYHIVGFAQPNIIYPNNPISKKLPLHSRLKNRLKYLIQEFFYSKADVIIVELEHVKKGLSNLLLFKNKLIHVVYSSVHTVYKDSLKWKSLNISRSSASLKLGIISRNYPHKNLQVLLAVKKCLMQDYGLNVDMYVTFTANEWSACDLAFQKEIKNVGGLNLSQCPYFYSEMDGIIFPSLLECFSAVPLEAMTMRRPLFASDLPFIRDICEDHCIYFNPLCPSDISRAIFSFYQLSATEREKHITSAFNFSKKYPSPEKRAENYIKIIRDTLTH